MKSFVKWSGPVALAVALVAAVLVAVDLATPAEEPVARTYGCAVYTEQGCAKFVVASGGEIEVQSGGTFDLQSGATTDFSSGMDLDGGLLDLDADGDTSLQADTDDQIDIEISAADDFRFTANTFTALSGSTIAANTIAETTAASGVTVDGLTLKDGGVQDAGGLDVIGTADTNLLVVTGYATQTNSLLVLEQSGGTDKLTVSNDGNTDVAGTLQYGANNLYPVGYASSGQQIVYGTASVTATLAAPHGLTTVTFCMAQLADDPSASSTDAAYVTTVVSGNVCTIKVWQDDLVSASAEAGSNVLWLVIGAP
jgi:hypothetical protein